MKKEKHSVCREAGRFYYDFLTKEQPVPARISRHIENCPACRREIERLQKELAAPGPGPGSLQIGLLRLQGSLFDQWVGCRQVLPFLPFLTASEPDSAIPSPVSVHLAHCPACRQDLEALRRLSLSPAQGILAGRYLADDDTAQPKLESAERQTLADIRQRPASGVQTRIRKNEKTGRFSISVAVERTDVKSAPAKRPVRWLQHGLAAAILMTAALLFWRIPAARGLDIKEIYQALGNAVNIAITSYEQQTGDNVFIASYAQEGQEPIQQIWISNALEIQLFIEKDRAVLWDLQRQQKIIRTAAGREILPIPYPVKKLETPWGLLPFRDLTELPDGYHWQSVFLPDFEKDPNTRIYDLTWTDASSGGTKIRRKWRGFLHARSKLPYRIEWWDQLPGQEFKQMTTTLITYPEEDQVLERIAAEGFDYLPASQK